METAFILLLIIVTVLFGWSNLSYLNSNDRNIEKLYRMIFYAYLSLFSIGFIISLFILIDLCWLDKVFYVVGGVVINPLLIIFPLSSFSNKISLKAKSIISGIFIVVYSCILIWGLIGMTAPGTTWGNSGLLVGTLCVIWSLPNILLATLMSIHYKFQGTVKLITGIVSLIIILITFRGSEYTGDTEGSFRTITFIMCGYFSFEGYLFIMKHNMTNL